MEQADAVEADLLRGEGAYAELLDAHGQQVVAFHEARPARPSDHGTRQREVVGPALTQ